MPLIGAILGGRGSGKGRAASWLAHDNGRPFTSDPLGRALLRGEATARECRLPCGHMTVWLRAASVILSSLSAAIRRPVRTMLYADTPDANDRAPSITAAGTAIRASGRGRPAWLAAAALLGPSLVFLAAFTYWPVLDVLVQSFMVGRFAGQQALGFGNYQRLFADQHFARAAWNNVVYAAGTIAPSLLLALPDCR